MPKAPRPRFDALLAPLWELFRQFFSIRIICAPANLYGIFYALPPRPVLPLADLAQRQVEKVFKNLPTEMTG